jgi:hypothetical protein
MSQGRCSNAACIVCERGGQWGVRLRQLLRTDGIVVHGCSNLTQCWLCLEQYPSSVVLLDTKEETFEGVVQLMDRIGRRFPHARMLVVLPRAPRLQEWWAREAGAIHVARSPREVGSVARLVRRYVQQAPPISMTWVQQVYARLPWPSH